MGRIKKCEEMEQHIGSLLSAILSRAFFLHLRTIDIRGAKRLQSASGVSDLAFATSNAALAAPEQALAFPPERAATVLNAHPVLFSHFFVNIMSEWDRCFDRIAPISGGGSGSWFIDQTVSRVHDVILRTIDLLCDNFVIGELLGTAWFSVWRRFSTFHSLTLSLLHPQRSDPCTVMKTGSFCPLLNHLLPEHPILELPRALRFWTCLINSAATFLLPSGLSCLLPCFEDSHHKP